VLEYVEEWIKAVKLSEDDLEVFGSLKQSHFDRELISETEAFSELFGIPFDRMLAAQYMYDFGATTMGCTSVVVRGKPNYIARNLDYDFQSLISKLSVVVHFY
jgi:hypothetical protein